MIKVLYTIPNFDTAGSGKALLKIAERLDRTKFEPQILCTSEKGRFFETVINSGIPIHIHQYTVPMIPRIQALIKCWKLSRYLKNLKMNIIHSFHYAPDYSEALAAKFANIPWVYTKKNMNWGGRSKNGWRLRTVLAKGIVVQNSDMIHSFFRGQRNTALIPRGVDTSEFYPRERKNGLLHTLGIEAAQKVLISVANLVPVKGTENIIRAFSLINNIDLKLVIVGDDQNQYASKLKSLVQELGLDDQVKFTGRVQNVPDYLAISDLFVLPTLNSGRMEGSPVAMLEAMASGVLVLGSNIPGIRDQLNKIPDQLFAPDDIDELSAKIERSLQLPVRIKDKLIARQLQIIEDGFRIEREVIRHQEFYQKIVA